MDIKLIGNIYQSVYKHIESLFVASGLLTGSAGDVTILDAYPDDEDLKRITSYSDSTGAADEIVLPIITLEMENLKPLSYELGSRRNKKQTHMVSTVFADTHDQRDFLIGLMDDFLDRDINLKNYNEGYTNPSVIGTILVTDMEVIPQRFFPTPNKALRWGADIFFVTETT